jgi:hypothetical protein
MASKTASAASKSASAATKSAPASKKASAKRAAERPASEEPCEDCPDVKDSAHTCTEECHLAAHRRKEARTIEDLEARDRRIQEDRLLKDKEVREEHIAATKQHLADFNMALSSKFPGGLVSAAVSTMASKGLLEMEELSAKQAWYWLCFLRIGLSAEQRRKNVAADHVCIMCGKEFKGCQGLNSTLSQHMDAAVHAKHRDGLKAVLAEAGADNLARTLQRINKRAISGAAKDLECSGTISKQSSAAKSSQAGSSTPLRPLGLVQGKLTRAVPTFGKQSLDEMVSTL